MKPAPTKKQRDAAAAKRAKMAEMAATIAAMSEEQRLALAGQGIATIEGRALSPHNSCMIIMQKRNASIVGGFDQWRTAGRSVIKGEKALALWFPVKPSEEGEESGKTRFRLGNVFDITQTAPTKF